MASSKFSFLFIFVAVMAIAAVHAAVATHHEPASITPVDNYLSAATISTKSGSKFVCNGVILNHQWIIVAANCVEHYSEADLEVSYGSIDRKIAQAIKNYVEKIRIHPKYEHTRLVSNVALLKVKTEIEFNSNVQAAIWPTAQTWEDELAYAVGWQKLQNSQTFELKDYNTKVMALDLCWERLEDLDAIKVNDNIICTYGFDKQPIDYVDSALFSKETNELIGVASWYQNEYPVVYSRIQSHILWIKTEIIHG